MARISESPAAPADPAPASPETVHGDAGRTGSAAPANRARPRAREGRHVPPIASTDPEVPAILQRAVDEAVRLLSADGALIGLLDDQGHLRFAYESGMTESRVKRWRTTMEASGGDGRGLIARSIVSRRAQRTDDYLADTSFEHSRRGDRMVREIGIRSLAAVPLIVDDRSIGSLAVHADRPSAFGERDVALAQALADHAAAAIATARLIERLAASEAALARRVEIQRSLATVGAALASLHDPAAVLQSTVDASVRLLDADGALLDLVDPTTGRIRWAYDAGIGNEKSRQILRALELQVGEGMFGRAVGEREVIVTGRYLADDRFVHAEGSDAFVRLVGIESMIAVPLVGDEGALGVIGIYTARPDAFGDDAVDLARNFASVATIALRNARFIDELDRSRAEIARRADAERTLREVAARLTTIRAPEELLRYVVEASVRVLHADRAQLDVMGPDGYLREMREAGDPELTAQIEPEMLIAPHVGMNALAIAARAGVVTDDYLADERFPHLPESDAYVQDVGIVSVAAAPLIADGEVLGVLKVNARRRAAFGEDDAVLLLAIAQQAAVALSNARLIDELERSQAEVSRQADVERTLREIGARISAATDSTEVVQLTVDEAVRLLGADGARIDLIDPVSGLLRAPYVSGERPTDDEWPDDPDEELHDGVGGRAVLTGAPFRTDDYLTDDRFAHGRSSDHYAELKGIRSVLAVPLAGDDGPRGALTAWSTRRSAFGERHETLLQALADQAAIALANARLIDALESSRIEVARRADAERALREISTRISGLRDPADVLQRTVDAASRLLSADGAILELVDPVDARLLRWAYDAGVSGRFDPRFVHELTLPIGVGLTGRAVEERRVIIADDDLAAEFPRSVESDQFFATTGYRSMLAAPIVGEAGPLGAIEVYSNRPGAFSERDAELISALATQAAIAIGNARLIADLDGSRKELARLAEQERTLREISGRITALRDPDEVLQQIVDEARRLLGSDGAHLTLMSEDRTFLRPVVASGVDDATRLWMLDEEFPLHGGLNGLAATLGRAVRSDDYLVDPRIPHEEDDQYVAARLGIRGIAIVPLRAPAGEIVGTLAVSFRTVREVDDAAVALLQDMAHQAGVAVSNSRLDALLRDSEARYRHLVENSPDLVWSIDEEARFTFLSDTCERLTGWRPDELLGGHFGGLVHPSSAEVAEIDWADGLADGTHEIRGRVALLHRDGHPIPAEFNAMSRVVDGRFVGANGSVRDMSERDHLERELKASEERYRFLVENSPDIIFSCDADGRFRYLSESMERLLGWAPADVVGQHFSIVVDAASMPRAAATWTHAVTNPGEPVSTRIDLVHKDGRSIPYDVRAVATAVDGVVTGLHGASRDASEAARLEAEVSRSEARFRDLVETSPDGVWQADADGRFTYWSETATALFGWTAADVVGRPYASIVSDGSIADAADAWGRLAAGDELVRVRIVLLHSDGSSLPAEVSGVGIRREGVFAGAQGTVRDLRERERLEGDLRRQAAELAARDERAHLARELHDSVTQALFSMTLLTRSIELLLAKDPAKAVERLATLRDLQRDALAEMRALIFELRPGGLEQDGLVPALRRQAAAVQGRVGLPVVVETTIEGRLPSEVEDVLYRIAQEALHNIVKHASARTVRVVLDRTSAGIHLSVVDDGSGFDATAVPPGHLGLAGMRARAERIGGRFVCVSRPGHGTAIEVVVPVVVAV